MGHSLVGAIAVLFQSHLIFQNSRMVTGLYTFGQPRVGDATFREQLDAHTTGQYHRYVNHNDIVPLLPSHLQHYQHAGSPIRFDRNGEPHRQDGLMSRSTSLLEDQLNFLVELRTGEDHNAMLNRLRSAPTQCVREHAITLYVNAIEKTIADGWV